MDAINLVEPPTSGAKLLNVLDVIRDAGVLPVLEDVVRTSKNGAIEPTFKAILGHLPVAESDWSKIVPKLKKQKIFGANLEHVKLSSRPPVMPKLDPIVLQAALNLQDSGGSRKQSNKRTVRSSDGVSSSSSSSAVGSKEKRVKKSQPKPAGVVARSSSSGASKKKQTSKPKAAMPAGIKKVASTNSVSSPGGVSTTAKTTALATAVSAASSPSPGASVKVEQKQPAVNKHAGPSMSVPPTLPMTVTPIVTLSAPGKIKFTNSAAKKPKIEGPK